MVGGVAQVLVEGTQKYAVRVQLDPSQLASRGLGLEDVNAAISGQNVNYATGVLWGTKIALTIAATGQLDNAADFRDMIVAYRNGAPVHLGDLGQVTDNVQNNKTASWLGDKRSIVLEIQRQPGTNTVLVASRIRAALAKIQTDIPASVQVSILYDRSTTIEDSVNDVKFTLALTLVLVVLVIFLFLRNLSATIIPSLALPMSIIGTFSAMYLLNYSLDNLSLMALTLAVGFVVDDAIVMLENIVRHLEMGKPRMQAAIDGAAEVGFTILSMTLSLSAVFIPILFMGGIIGKLFHEFAVTIGVSILVSGLRVPDTHADAQQPVPPVGAARAARASVQGDRAGFSSGVARVRAKPGVGDGPPTGDARLLRRRSHRNHRALFRHPEGTFPDRRHGSAAWYNGGRRRRLVRRAGRAPAAGR